MQIAASRTESVVRSFFARTYSWMTAGLVLTAAIAYFTANNPAMRDFVRGAGLFLVLIQLGIVMFMSFAIRRVNSGMAGILFMVYAALTGLVFSGLFVRYAGADITVAFAVSAGTFGAMSLFGFLTKINLGAWGRFLMMALIGLLIAMIVNIFVASTPFTLIISGIGVLLFSAMTAYDTQMLRNLALNGFGDGEAHEKAAVYGALNLYLDFVNLFLFILRFVGIGGSSRN